MSLFVRVSTRKARLQQSGWGANPRFLRITIKCSNVLCRSGVPAPLTAMPLCYWVLQSQPPMVNIRQTRYVPGFDLGEWRRGEIQAASSWTAPCWNGFRLARREWDQVSWSNFCEKCRNCGRRPSNGGSRSGIERPDTRERPSASRNSNPKPNNSAAKIAAGTRWRARRSRGDGSGAHFWMKATILHAEYHCPAAQPSGERFYRHYSDLAALWK